MVLAVAVTTRAQAVSAELHFPREVDRQRQPVVLVETVETMEQGHLPLVVQAELLLSTEELMVLRLVVLVVTEVLQVLVAFLRHSVEARQRQVLRARCPSRSLLQCKSKCCLCINRVI